MRQTTIQRRYKEVCRKKQSCLIRTNICDGVPNIYELGNIMGVLLDPVSPSDEPELTLYIPRNLTLKFSSPH